MSEASAETRNDRKTLRGVVVSDKMAKTIVVEVEDRRKHGLYGKIMKRHTKFMAHDETEQAGIGDTVVIAETRPLSASKRWRLAEIVEKAE
ncbi:MULTISPECIES: 30S ribosomal protein S17 [Nesterenkonia]|uniref:Small ribosomal subunit protein uS17 n=1 Tax=Nesterenkonia halotolerans TaxID=225325 RepID=A0ABR9J8W1_9MICC|nr:MULTISPECIES: 30S ribosomal protein S17 [Nesterenkonia]MBE1515436.1 small subunit ribosomal protein S17 [Nesterenkonia halotolerans]